MPLMTRLAQVTCVEPVTELVHGMTFTAPHRWLEDQNSPRTREWIFEHTRYAQSFLDVSRAFTCAAARQTDRGLDRSHGVSLSPAATRRLKRTEVDDVASCLEGVLESDSV
jgi:prolyl oligopeptidase PreP (S9A serine peptidase family)